MDLNFDLNEMTFNYRVASLIRKDDMILLEYNSKYNYYSFIGGRVKIGEDSKIAIKREFKEEAGYDINPTKLWGIVENFFVSRYKNSHYHELLFIYNCEFKNKEIIEEIKNLEDKQNIFKWVKIKDINEDNFKPQVLVKFLNSEEFIHIINKD